VFDTLSDRLSGIFAKLRGKGRLSDADIDATAREIRLALLEADVALPVVKSFVARLKERARGVEVSQALNPAQQVIKIVHEELVGVLGGEARRLQFAKHPPTVIMLAGLQGSGKTTLAGTSRCWSRPTSSAPTRSTSSRCWAGRPAQRCTRRSPATARATRSRWPAIRSSMPAGSCATS
jgi:signal recognition particle subunit SRP54